MGKPTVVQIKRPYIIEQNPADPTTEDEELGTDCDRGMLVTTIGPRTIDHNAGPLSRYWSTRSSDQVESALPSKDMTCQG